MIGAGDRRPSCRRTALGTAPRVLLMDEPTEGLAPQIVAEAGAIVGRLHAAGLSVILLEQHTAFALSLADEVVVIRTGRVVDKAPAADFQADPTRLEEHLGVR